MARKNPEKYAHGTLTRYIAGCRCDECREHHLQAVYAATRKAQEHVRNGGEPKSHGASGYSYWGCRCDICKQAYREKQRRKRLRNPPYTKAQLKQRKTVRDYNAWSQNLSFPEV